jgi:predicted nucleotide-binding protein (sugar kinase/HSP70/actin superfamily)
MTNKIGIPRALLYYSYFPLWRTFYEELGAEVVVSSNTSKNILDDGLQVTVDEACLPVKVFHGHVMELANKVDLIFIPRLISVKHREYICPKFMGLPDMVRASVKRLPQIISVDADLSKNIKNLRQQIRDAAYPITRNQNRVQRAFKKALHSLSEFRLKLNQGKIPDFFSNSQINVTKSKQLKILLLGHPYNIYDSHINMDIIKKLNRLGVTIITPEMIPYKAIENIARSFKKPLFWSLGKNMLGSLIYSLENKQIDGVIHVVSFGCGPDSMIGEMAERWTQRKYRKPYMLLTIDEHTGEAGFNTRLEAFVDLIERKKEFETHISSYGESSHTN